MTHASNAGSDQWPVTYWISLKAEVADPELGPVVHLAQRVKDGPAVVARAQHGVVLDRRQVGPLLDGLVQASQGDHQPRRLYPARRPHVPGEPDPVAVLVLLDIFLVRRHLQITSQLSIKNFTQLVINKCEARTVISMNYLTAY